MLESARYQWDQGGRRLGEEQRDPARYAQLCDLVALVLDELRRRIGSHYTLTELAAAHRLADDWVRDLVRDAIPEKARVGVADAAVVQDAAFLAFARGAGDWTP